MAQIRLTRGAAAAALALALLVSTSSCRQMRAQVGVGLGIGAQVKVPKVLHFANVSAGVYKYAGEDYGEGEDARTPSGARWWEFDIGLVLPHLAIGRDYLVADRSQITTRGGQEYITYHQRYRHLCFGLAPTLAHDEGGEAELQDALEIDLFLLFFAVRLGWNPNY